MKYEEPQKITALGVVIFSFISLLLGLALIALVDVLSAFLVLKTSLPESFLKVGSVLGCGIGLITATAFLTARGKVKGIVAAGILSACLIIIKILGNAALKLGGYFTWNGFIGILFVVVFCLIGGVLGSSLKKR
ncbi:MAG: hypothetical protein DBX52_06720 [Clostridiales bacterium]|nr:MAG: hypothetical protein DBX52_06720 [Clostridiales bacterium]